MATIGLDCQIILDGNGFFLMPHTYEMLQPRVRKATVRADGNESYVDLGPGKKVWKMIVLAVNDLNKYDGTSTGLSGQQYRDNLRNSFTGSVGTTISFTDPQGFARNVHFDSYMEHVNDVRVQQIAMAAGSFSSLTYLVDIELVEA